MPDDNSEQPDTSTKLALMRQDLAFMRGDMAEIKQEFRDIKQFYMTKEEGANLRSDVYKDFGNLKAAHDDLRKSFGRFYGYLASVVVGVSILIIIAVLKIVGKGL